MTPDEHYTEAKFKPGDHIQWADDPKIYVVTGIVGPEDRPWQPGGGYILDDYTDPDEEPDDLLCSIPFVNTQYHLVHDVS